MTQSTLVWTHDARTLVGSGEIRRFDPGVGAGRYHRALEALRSSGGELAFASFTFDPEEPGSVVLIPGQVERPEPPFPATNPHPAAHLISDGAAAWQQAILEALAAVEVGKVEKVVLARQVEVTFDSEPDLEKVVWTLRSRQPGCYTFLIEGLVGSSPELLLSLQQDQVISLSLAGTAATEGGSLGSAKIELEHRLAAESVEWGLASLVTDLTQRREIVEVAGLKHRATRFAGSAVDGVTFADLLAALHPTAAVAGTPRLESMALIREIEPRRRGRYAGPVGWFDVSGRGEFAIALRCALVQGRRGTLYAGGGIVAGSDPEEEFAETELKLRPMMEVLGLDGGGDPRP